jgi:hypothetical protein
MYWCSTACARDRRDFRLLVDFRAFGTGTLAQRHREVRRRDVAVVRVEQRTDDGGRVRGAAELEQRP